MLRVSFLVSIGLHVLIFSLFSVFVSPQERQPAPPEQRFKVEFVRQKITANPAQTDERMNSAPRKTMAEPFQRQPDFPPPISTTQKRQQLIVNSPQIRFSDRSVLPQVMVPPPTSQRKTVLAQPDFVAVAQAFPTPIPTPKPTAAPTARPTQPLTPKPTPVPTQKPTPQPAARPTAIPTQQPRPMPTIALAAAAVRQIPEQSATPATTALTPVSSHSQPQESTQSVQTQRMRQETEEEQAIEAQPAPDVLQRYLQQVVKKIDARKAYPRQARSKGWQGTVVIKVQIVSDGTVTQLELVTPSEYDTLNKAALEAIKKAQPFPKFPDEIKNPSLTINIPIQFTLK